MTLELMQQTGVSFVTQPIAATDRCLITAVGRNVVVLEHNAQQRILPGHSKTITALCASKCGNYVASSQDSCVCVWDMNNGQARVIETPGRCTRLSFSLSGRFLCVAYDGCAVDVYEMENMGRVGRAGPVGTVDAAAGTAGGSGGGGAGGYAAYGDYCAYAGGKPTPASRTGTLGAGTEVAGAIPWAAWGADETHEILITPADSSIFVHRVVFNRASLEFELATTRITIPASVAVRRRWTSGALFGTTAIVGTAGGELAFFDVLQSNFAGITKFCGSPICAVENLGYGILIAGSTGELLSLAGRSFNLKVASEVSLGTEIHAVCVAGSAVYAMTRTGSVIALRAKNADLQVGPMVKQRPTAPGARDYSVALPEGRDSFAKPAAGGAPIKPQNVVDDQGVLPGPELELNTLQVCATFPPGPLHATVYVAGMVIAGTETGFVQVWAPGALRAQIQLSKMPSCALCIELTPNAQNNGQPNVSQLSKEIIIYAGFEDGWVHKLQLNKDFTLTQLGRANAVQGATGRTGAAGSGSRVVQAAISSMAAVNGKLAIGCSDGRLFIFDAQTMASTFQLTERFGSVVDLKFDRIEPSLLHVSAIVSGAGSGPAAPGRPQGILQCFDTSQNCALVKSRQLPCVAQSICQVFAGRFEVLAACADGIIRVFDFDVDNAVQELLPPNGVFAGQKMTITCQIDGKTVVAGYVTENDGAVALLVYGERGLEAVGSQLTHGIEPLSAMLEGDTLVLPGAGGELAFYRCV